MVNVFFAVRVLHMIMATNSEIHACHEAVELDEICSSGLQFFNGEGQLCIQCTTNSIQRITRKHLVYGEMALQLIHGMQTMRTAEFSSSLFNSSTLADFQ